MREERARLALAALALAAALLALARVEPPSVADAREPPPLRVARSSAAAPTADAAVGEGAEALRDGAPVDLNRATAAELALLPGIGPTLAERIVAHRERVGTFGSLSALAEVRGVGPRTVERIGALATVGQ